MKNNQAAEGFARENPLARDYDFVSLLRFACPTMVMMLCMGLYTIGDTIFVSRFVNTYALSAINIVCPVINLIVGLGTMLAAGGCAIVARKMGACEVMRARQDFTLLVAAGMCVGAAIAILGIIFLEPLVWGLGASELLYPYCKDYLFVILLFTPASILQILFQSLIVTAGRPGIGLCLSLGAGAVNVLLDYIFMVHLEMGIVGSALGTGIGYMIPAVIGILFFIYNQGDLRFHWPVFDLRVLRESCLNGSSEMVSQLAAAITTFLFNAVMLKLLGENGVAAITMMIYSQFFFITLYIGFAMGVGPIISYNYGSQNHQRLKRIFRICFYFIGGLSLLIFALAHQFSSHLVALFAPPDTEVYPIARKGFRIFSYTFLFCGMNIFSSAAFTALSNGTISAIISFSRTFVFILAALLILPKYMGVTGVWLAIPLAECITLFLSVGFICNYRKVYHCL